MFTKSDSVAATLFLRVNAINELLNFKYATEQFWLMNIIVL